MTRFRLTRQQLRAVRVAPGRVERGAQLAAELTTPASASSFERALEQVISRHEALRSLLSGDERSRLPMQEVHEHLPALVRRIPTGTIPAHAALARRIEEVAAEERDVPFDGYHGPLVRVALLVEGEDAVAFVLTLASICGDAHSSIQIASELGELVTNAAMAAAPSAQYLQYADWHAALLETEESLEGQAFWSGIVERAGAQRGLRLGAPSEAPEEEAPVEASSQAGPSVSHSRPSACRRVVSFSVPRKLVDELGEARTVLAGAWALLIWRHTSASSVSFVLEHDARCFPEFEGMVGACAQKLPVVVELDPTQSTKSFLRELQDRLRALDNWHPLVETLGTARDPFLPESAIAFEYLDATRFETGPFRVVPSLLHGMTEGSELKFVGVADSERIELSLWYDPDRYSDSTARSLCDSLSVVLDDLSRRPDATLLRIGAAPSAVRQEVARRARQTREPASGFLLDAVLRHSQERPHALAAVSEGRQLSYGALKARAERLSAEIARRLGRSGPDGTKPLGADSVVAIVMPASIDLLVCMLAAWQLGAAFAVIDVNWPSERVAEALAVLQPAVTIRGLDAPLEGAAMLERSALAPEGAPVFRPAPPHPKQLAYVVFTTGTGGVLKGVMVEHQQIHNYSAAIAERLSCRPGDRFLALTTFAADLVYTALFPALLSGGCVHIVDRARALDGRWLARYIERWGIDFVKTVPSHLMALGGDRSAFSSVRLLILGGEAVPPALLGQIRDWRFINHYGPAETTVGVLTETPGTPHRAGNPVPLGCPLPHVHCHVEMPGQQLAPTGSIGELVIGGHSISRGYLGRPRDTAVRFRPDEWSEREGSRVYMTGDLVLSARDGDVYFKGRRDTQIKVRGYRVEPSAVASVLASNPAVQHAHVRAARDEGAHGTSLHAYAVVAPAFLDAAREEQYQLWLRNWQDVFERAYADDTMIGQSHYSSASWKSSYTGDSMPESDILEQMEGICARVRGWNARTVLEIGCGTGSLIMHLAPHCEAYVATDFCAPLLRRTEDLVARYGLSSRVNLVEACAHEFERLGAMKFDVIVLNSVIQYFADTEYLEKVLQGAEQRLNEGGRILIGDVRDSRLLRPLHASVAHYKVSSAVPTKKWARQVERRVELDSELSLEPAYFVGLPARLKHVREAHVSLKRGRAKNELVCFRYDVTLSTRSSQQADSVRPHQWSASWTLETLAQRLENATRSALVVSSIPNERLLGPVWLAHQMGEPSASATCEDLTRGLERLPRGVDPEELCCLAESLSYDVLLCPTRARLDRFDAVFVKRGCGSAEEHAKAAFGELERDCPDARPITTPLLKRLGQTLAPELLDACRRRLPEYMVPSRIVLLHELPVNLNGKLDESRLPSLGGTQLSADVHYIEPAGPVERVVAAVWEETLGVDRVGAHDDFFSLGGHSLLATEVVARLEAIFQARLPLSSFFGTSPNVRGVASLIVDNELEAGQAAQIAELWEQIQTMTEAEVEARLGETSPASAV